MDWLEPTDADVLAGREQNDQWFGTAPAGDDTYPVDPPEESE